MAIETARRPRRRRDGQRHRRPSRQCGLPRPAARHARPRRRARSSRCARPSPQPLMLPENARLITPGNFDERHGASSPGTTGSSRSIVEDLGAKRALYDRIDAARKPGSIVSSNTSTIPLQRAGGQAIRSVPARFLHHPFLQPAALHAPARAGDRARTRSRRSPTRSRRSATSGSARASSAARTRPGFIANRIGTHWMTVAVNEAIERGLTIEEADAVHRPMGMPKTGVFGLIDLVGLDLMPLVAGSLLAHAGRDRRFPPRVPRAAR